MKVFILILFYTFLSISWAYPKIHIKDKLGSSKDVHQIQKRWARDEESTSDFWFKDAQEFLLKQLKKKYNTDFAKNVIFFLGDGMSLSTITAARMYLKNEETQLSFEKFPNVGLVKTYCADSQVADSACSATAFLCGAKANIGTIGVSTKVPRGSCEAMSSSENHLPSIASKFQRNGRKTGLVTNTRLTHASPAGIYAHSADRNWESDVDIKSANQNSSLCKDIALQLIEGSVGQKLNVVLGGGLQEFVPKSLKGKREDQRNLIDKWLQDHSSKSKFITTKAQLKDLSSKNEDYVLGIFAQDHLAYHLDQKDNEPTLEEMTESAIKLLSNPEGYFLFVESGKIDLAHHENYAEKALDETIELAKAVQRAIDLTNENDTLIIVTADHSHTMTIAGYPEKGSDILGFSGAQDLNGKPYKTLSYANGPGFNSYFKKEADHERFPAMIPLDSETHGGDDVAIYASGPWSHLFTGVMEQNVIPHLIAYASCTADSSACSN